MSARPVASPPQPAPPETRVGHVHLEVADLDRAIAFVQAALAAAPGLGQGHGPMGHGLGMVPFYHLLAALSREGWDAAAFAARWG